MIFFLLLPVKVALLQKMSTQKVQVCGSVMLLPFCKTLPVFDSSMIDENAHCYKIESTSLIRYTILPRLLGYSGIHVRISHFSNGDIDRNGVVSIEVQV